MNHLYNDLRPLPELEVPPLSEDSTVFLLNLRRKLYLDKVSCMPQGSKPEDVHNFVILSHRLDAQIELVDTMLQGISNQVNETGD